MLSHLSNWYSKATDKETNEYIKRLKIQEKEHIILNYTNTDKPSQGIDKATKTYNRKSTYIETLRNTRKREVHTNTWTKKRMSAVP